LIEAFHSKGDPVSLNGDVDHSRRE
jgi:hypothetical protein